jgi:hypothetical protein
MPMPRIAGFAPQLWAENVVKYSNQHESQNQGQASGH